MLPQVRVISVGAGNGGELARVLARAQSFDLSRPLESTSNCLRYADHAFLLDVAGENPLGWRYRAQFGVERLEGAADAASACLGEHVDQAFTRGVLIPSYREAIDADQPMVHRIAAVSNDTLLSYHRISIPLRAAPRRGRTSDLLMLTRLDLAIPQIHSRREGSRRLTFRERQCLALAASGLVGKQMAAEIGVSEKMIELHLARARNKLGARTTTQAVAVSVALAMVER